LQYYYADAGPVAGGDAIWGGLQEERHAVVLQPAPDRVAARNGAGVRVVVLERVVADVRARERRRRRQAAGVDAAVVPDVDGRTVERDCVLVGMRRRRTVVQPAARARQPE